MAHLSSTGRSAEPANKNQKRSDGSAAAARADDRLSVGKRLIKEPGSNPDHTALPNPLVSSPSGRRVARARWRKRENQTRRRLRATRATKDEALRLTRIFHPGTRCVKCKSTLGASPSSRRAGIGFDERDKGSF